MCLKLPADYAFYEPTLSQTSYRRPVSTLKFTVKGSRSDHPDPTGMHNLLTKHHEVS
jgi:hypothetical protein